MIGYAFVGHRNSVVVKMPFVCRLNVCVSQFKSTSRHFEVYIGYLYPQLWLSHHSI